MSFLATIPVRQIRWHAETICAVDRFYLLPLVYVGRHDVGKIVEGAGPNWKVSIGWLCLEFVFTRTVEEKNLETPKWLLAEGE